MRVENHLKELGFTGNEAACYLALVANAPINGSQLSRIAGVSRSKIYEILGKMVNQGYAVELEEGLYGPLPPEELSRRLRSHFDIHLKGFDEQIKSSAQELTYDYVWTVRGYSGALSKAQEMISSAMDEIYIRVSAEEAGELEGAIMAARERGVLIKCVSMGRNLSQLEHQVVLIEPRRLKGTEINRSLDLVVDRNELLTGMIEPVDPEKTIFKWTHNRWLILICRDSLRQDFLRYFLNKILDLGQPLNERERAIYQLVKSDD